VAVRPNVAVTEIAVGLQLEGVDPGLARQAAEQVSREDPIAGYARHELGLVEERRARPLQAALASAASFLSGGVWPVLGLLAPTRDAQSATVVGLAVAALAVAGALSADVGGASRRRAALRVTLGGGVAMGVSAVIGRLVGAVV
jgi:VIT1/CCC1 family predicted Fe2+/Mn2+ transporter